MKSITQRLDARSPLRTDDFRRLMRLRDEVGDSRLIETLAAVLGERGSLKSVLNRCDELLDGEKLDTYCLATNNRSMPCGNKVRYPERFCRIHARLVSVATQCSLERQANGES